MSYFEDVSLRCTREEFITKQIVCLAAFFGLAACAKGSTGKLKPGDAAPVVNVKSIHGVAVAISDSKAKWVHLQFRRFAGCPICNLHLQSFIQRNQEIANAGIREVVVFHSPDSSLLPYQGEFPFIVIGDPEKKL